MSDYRNLEVWQRAHRLTLDVYRLTHGYPASERFGLTMQTRRAAVSIPSNVAEGAGRGSDRDFARFVGIAIGSTNEAEYQLLLACDLGYLPSLDFGVLASELAEVRSMLTGLRQWLSGAGNPGRRSATGRNPARPES
ncbi:MAG TPA: four helix bundle protein [Acidimicrobiia bacterium]|nr:four helix bundle protein [Acidimicrobiia bacterium]